MMQSTHTPTRRRLLSYGAAVAASSVLGIRRQALATVSDLEQAIARLGEGAMPVEGGMTLTIPEVAENGNSVAVSVSVASPMTIENHVQTLMLLAPENPNTEVAVFHFTPMSGEASVTTRMRLARTQTVTAVARSSDGTLRKTSTSVRVTVGGCGAQ